MAENFVRVALAPGDEQELTQQLTELDYVELTGTINGQEIPLRFYRAEPDRPRVTTGENEDGMPWARIDYNDTAVIVRGDGTTCVVDVDPQHPRQPVRVYVLDHAVFDGIVPNAEPT